MNQWYYGSQGQQIGPVVEAELRRLIGTGVITRETMVWREGMAEWRMLAEVAELLAPQVAGMGAMSYPQAYPNMVPNSGLAIASMCCGIASLIFCYVNALAGIPAVICGHMALKKIRESEWPIGGRGMAIAGLVTGYLGILIQLATIGIIVFAVMSATASGPSSSVFP
jgi:hypothetical protein